LPRFIFSINNSTFKDGIAGDAIRNIIGSFNSAQCWINTATGALYYSNGPNSLAVEISTIQSLASIFNFDPSRVVPTATDNRVRTLAERFWRRVA
jgi:hypothetical protein